MEDIVAGEPSMARRPKVKNSMPMRLSEDAIRLARIAAGYTAESIAEYISRITCERSREDIDKFHDQLKHEQASKPPEPEVQPVEAPAPKKKKKPQDEES